MLQAGAWIGAAAVILAGCGEAARVETAETPTPVAAAAVETSEAESGDPYGLLEARNYGRAKPELEACASDPDCAEHAEAGFWLAFLNVLYPEDEKLGSGETATDAFLRDLYVQDEPWAAMVDCAEHGRGCDSKALESTGVVYVAESEDPAALRQASIAALKERTPLRERRQRKRANFLRQTRAFAALGSPSANSLLGKGLSGDEYVRYEYFDVERNDALAVDHYIAAADGGSVEGSYNLAQMIHVGRAGPTHDVDALLRWAYSSGMEQAGHILLQRQRERGVVDPELEARLESDVEGLVNGIYARGNWGLHPDKPETKVAMQRFVERETEALLEKLEAEGETQ